MSTVDELFDRYKAAFSAGERPDPEAFLAQVAGGERRLVAVEEVVDAGHGPAPVSPSSAARRSTRKRRTTW